MLRLTRDLLRLLSHGLVSGPGDCVPCILWSTEFKSTLLDFFTGGSISSFMSGVMVVATSTSEYYVTRGKQPFPEEMLPWIPANSMAIQYVNLSQ